MTTTFTTMDEARDYVADTLGEYAEGHDLDAITDEITEWRGGVLIIKAEYAEDEPGLNEAYWALVEAHAKYVW